MEEWERPARIFLHFFDTHFLEVKEAAINRERIRKECKLATRFALLAAQNVLVPAASFFESSLCREVLGELEPIYDTGFLRLVGGGANLAEFFEDKRRQYCKDSLAHADYFQPIPPLFPAFTGRERSATKDIITRWNERLKVVGSLGEVFDGTGITVPKDIEKTWMQIAERLGDQAFIVDHVEPLLLGKPTHPVVRNRLHAIINAAYFESFTREFQAGVITDLVFLHAPHPVPSWGTDLSYKFLREEARRQDLLSRIVSAGPTNFLELRHEAAWLAILTAGVRATPRIDVIDRFYALPRPTELQVFAEDIDSFSKIKNVKPDDVSDIVDNGYFPRLEDDIQTAIEEILGMSFHTKDWAGEISDLYSTYVQFGGRRTAAAFLLKGRGKRTKQMTIADCGKNGDQIVRLFESPAELFVVQFVGAISEAVIKDFEIKVEHRRFQGKRAWFLILDGQETARLLRAYGKA